MGVKTVTYFVIVSFDFADKYLCTQICPQQKKGINVNVYPKMNPQNVLRIDGSASNLKRRKYEFVVFFLSLTPLSW